MLIKKSNSEEFINKAKLVHGEKYDYSEVNYLNSKIKVSIICPIHGKFEQTPNNHLHKYGCIICSGKFKPTTEEYIMKAKIIHSTKYDYSETKYINSYSKIKIRCLIHGEFELLPISHLNGIGCTKCSGLSKSNNIEFIKKANIIHNMKYDYFNINYINNKSNIFITCKIHGDFLQTPQNHLHGQGCPKCNNSKGEILIENYLKEKMIEYETQKKFKCCIGNKRILPFDFYLPKYNIVIEFDGRHHFEIVRFNGCNEISAKNGHYSTIKNDIIKNNFCEKNNIKILRIPYYEKDMIKILNENIRI